MATEAQINANRQNAQKSTGPRTTEGRTASSRNSITHGLCADTYFLNDEDTADFDILLDDLRDRYHPAGDAEEKVILRIAAAQWRLDRTLAIEVQIYRCHFARLERVTTLPFDPNETLRLGRLFMADCDSGGNLLKLSRYEASLERSIKNCVRQLEAFQKARATSHAETETAKRTQSTTEIAPTIVPDLAPDPSETLNIAIGGPAPTQHTCIEVQNEANLAGLLNLSLRDGYLPAIGQTFTILTARSITGTFCAAQGLIIAPDRQFDLTYNPTEVTLTVRPQPITHHP